MIKINNWSKWQSYRADRGQPPWIKIHREVMRKVEWVGMNDAQRGQLVAMWLLAADRDGVIPASPSIIQKLCFMDSEPDIDFFIEQGFISYDASVTPERRQHGQPETETETDTDKTSCESTDVDSRSESVPVKKIINLYHETCSQNPRVIKVTPARAQIIKSRWRNELTSLKDWGLYFNAVSQSSFLTGRVPPNGNRSKPFVADIDFLTKQGNVVKVMEGKYDD